MRKMSYYVVLLLSGVLFYSTVSASKIVTITGYDVRLRSSGTTNSTILATLSYGTKLSLVSDETVSGTGCTNPWYRVQYGSQIGYVCGDFADISEVKEIEPSDYKEYSDYLKKIGFPDSYIGPLVELHTKHPNWQFKVMNTDIDFNRMITFEYDGRSYGWSLLEDYGNNYDGYKSTDSWSYNYLTNVFSNKFSGGGTYWFAANKDTIGYYLDPRNFLNEQQIFMFETLSYNSNYHTKNGIEKMLEGTFMIGYADNDSEKTYADAFIDAAIKYNVSPYVLVSRVIQEVGANGSTIVSGTVSGYEGYYNFYNIKAYGNSKDETIRNGLEYAKSEGWDSPYKAIVGGGSFLSDSYISQGQDTLYLQKWDLFGPNYGAHQYMQNIQAPSTESIKTYRGYNNSDLIDSNFMFVIPVFKNMPSETKLPNKGNPNNYLSTLSINGNYLFEKATHDTTFDVNLDGTTSSVMIDATKVSPRSTISGVGSVSLKGGKQAVKITVTAENGNKREYTINITRNMTQAIDISEILRVTGIKNDGNYIYGIKLKTNVTDVIKKITDKEAKAKVSYFDKFGKEKKSGIVASGDKINIKTDREEKNYTFIIYGDVSGDGLISSADYIALKNHIMDVKKLSDLEKLFADANRDGMVSSADYIAIKNHIMNVKEIVQ